MKYDVIIIGAGAAGIATAANLSHYGIKVKIIEKNSNVGGYCTSLNKNGYMLTMGAHHIGGLSNGDVINRLLEKLNLKNRIELKKSPPITNYYGNESVEVPFEGEELRNLLKSISYEDNKAIDIFMGDIKGFSNALIEDNEEKIGYYFMKWCRPSFYEYLKNIFKSEKIIAILSSLGPGYGGITADGSALTMCSLLATYSNSAYYIIGGVYKLLEVLLEKIEDNASEVALNAELKKIITNKNKITGVIYEQNGKVKEDECKFLVTTSSLKQVYSMVDEYNDKRFKTKLNNMKIGPSAYRLHLIFKEGYELPKSDYGYFPSYNVLEWNEFLTYDREKHNKEKSPIYLACQVTKVDKSLVCNNRNSMFVTILTKELYVEEDKEKLISDFIEILNEKFHNLKENIEQAYLNVPKDFEEYTLNDNGAVFGWDRTPYGSLQSNALAPKGTIEGLYTAGQWGPNNGVYGAFYSGEKVSKLILKELK